MSTQNDFSRSFGVNSAMSAGVRVSLSSNGKIGLAGTADPGIGVLQQDCAGQSYENPKVRFWGTGSVMIVGTGAPATRGDFVFAAANGAIAPTAAVTPMYPIGRLVESYTSNGVVVEVVPVGPFQSVTTNILQ